MRIECDGCGFQTEDPSSLHIHQAEMHRNRTKKIIGLGDVGVVIPTTNHTRKTDYGAQFGSELLEVASSSRGEDAPTDSNGGRAAMRQRLGTLNFLPLNPENDARGDQDEREN